MRGKGGKAFKRTTSRRRKLKRLRPRLPFGKQTPLADLERELMNADVARSVGDSASSGVGGSGETR